MKVLSISTDRDLFSEGSEVRKRMIEYSHLFDEFHIVVFSKKNLKLQTQKISDNCWIHPTNSLNKWFYFFGAKKIGKRILSLDSRSKWVVSSQDPFETGLVAYFLSRYAKAKFNIQVHTDFLDPSFSRLFILNKIRVRIARFLLPKADSVRVVSKRIFDALTSGNLKLKTIPSVLPIFVDGESIKNTEVDVDLHKKYPDHNFIILIASRLVKEKNIGLAINAFRNLLEKYPKTLLLIVGNGPEEEKLKNQVEAKRVGNNIFFEPHSDNLISYFKTCDLFLLTSNYEGYGRTLVEALFSGCKIISSDVGVARELLPSDNIFKPENQKELEEKLVLALKGKIKKAKPFSLKTKTQYLEAYKAILIGI